MKYFTVETIKQAIEHLQNFSANWLLPAFVFAANKVGTESLVDMSKEQGTDQFLDRYFNGKRVGLPPMASGNNLLRPRTLTIPFAACGSFRPGARRIKPRGHARRSWTTT